VAKGGRVLVPAGKIAYVEFGGAEARRVGFGNIALSPVLRRVISGVASFSASLVVSGRPDRGYGPDPGIVGND
jgi:hypothetical protein